MGTTLKMSTQMKANVDYIMTSDNKDHDPTLKIEERPKGGFYKLVCKFFGTNVNTNEPFEFLAYQVKFFDIQQHFVEKFTDEVSLRVSLTPAELLQLVDNHRELKCLIQMFPYSINDASVDWSEKKSYTPVISKEYMVFFKNDEDPRKMLPKSVLIPKDASMENAATANNYVEHEFTLIDELAYKVRKRSVNFQLRDATVTEIILQGCSLLGIDKISMVPPDNKQVYQNVIIPPRLTFDEFFRYVNSFFGVYEQGYNFYITDKILYIYPMYNTDTKSPYVTHFYNAGTNTYEGAPVFHAQDTDKNYHVVINTQVNTLNMQDDSPENLGSHFLCLDADQIIDHASSLGESENTANARLGLGKLKVTGLKTYLVSSGKDDVGAVFDVFNPKYVFDWNNKYSYKGLLAASRGTFTTFKWSNAVPLIFYPGYRIQYHYDSETTERDQEEVYGDTGRYATKVGTCYQCSFHVESAQREGNDLVYSCKADISLFLSQDDLLQKSDSSKSTMSNTDKGIVRTGTKATTTSVGIF